MAYLYEKKYGGETLLRIETIFKQAMTSEKGGQFLYEQLHRQGLSYRKQNILSDYRRFQAIDRSLTPESRARAESWYDKVYEPFRKEMGYNAKQATEALHRIREGDINTEAEAEASGQYAEAYESAFD